MVNATVDNTPVTVLLSNNESVSVPTGEVWDVTISLSVEREESGSGANHWIKLNNGLFASARGSGNDTATVDVVASDGDTFKSGNELDNNYQQAALISGYVVSQ